MIICLSVRFAYDEIDAGLHNYTLRSRYPHNVHNYTEYHERSDLKFKPQYNDFHFRPSMPSTLDIVVSIWIIGIFFSHLYLLSVLIDEDVFRSNMARDQETIRKRDLRISFFIA